MAKEILGRDQLALSTLSAITSLKDAAWVEPENTQKTYLKDYRRHNIQIIAETDAPRGAEDHALEVDFKAALEIDGFSDVEIERLKHYYSQNLLSINVGAMIEALMKQGLTPAQDAQESQNRRIFIKKTKLNGRDVIVAEAEYWDIQVYRESSPGVLDDTRRLLIPGKLKSVFILEENGFTLLHIEASNSYLSGMVQGQAIDKSIEAIARGAVEEEHANAIEDLTTLAESTQDQSLAKKITRVKTEIEREKLTVDTQSSDYVERVNRLNTTANIVTAAVEMPNHAPTLKKLQDEVEAQAPSKLKWALIGVASVLVLGACVTASVMSFGVLAPPSIIAGVAAAGVASQALSIVLGTAALAGASSSAYQVTKPSVLSSIYNKLSFFSAPKERTTSKKDALDEQNSDQRYRSNRLLDG